MTIKGFGKIKTNIYIDGNNLYRAASDLGFEIDYKKFLGWLRQKFNFQNIYLFIGLVPVNLNFYNYLQDCGYKLVFKQTISVQGKIKGNCDAELVLKVVSDFYKKEMDEFILISGDGDFGCLVEFLLSENISVKVVSPDYKKCSILLKNKNTEIFFLNDHYKKIAKIKEKPPI
jgi:uncharacterized LabA/DUF88 family protein